MAQLANLNEKATGLQSRVARLQEEIKNLKNKPITPLSDYQELALLETREWNLAPLQESLVYEKERIASLIKQTIQAYQNSSDSDHPVIMVVDPNAGASFPIENQISKIGAYLENRQEYLLEFA